MKFNIKREVEKQYQVIEAVSEEHSRIKEPDVEGEKAGLGITVLPANMLPTGIHPIRKEIKLPELADAEIAFIKRDDLPRAGEMLAEHIVHSMENM